MAPRMAPELLSPPLPKRDFAAVVLTSETGVEAARRISAAGVALPKRAFCVGDRTAKAAPAAGFDAISAQGDANALLALLVGQKIAGPLLLLHAEDTVGDVQNRLISAGIETVSAITYRQKPQPLTAEAEAVLQSDTPVILPIFSPRSAHLLAAEIKRIGGKAPLWLAALSPAVAEAFDLPIALIQIAARPDAAAMLAAVTELRRHGISS